MTERCDLAELLRDRVAVFVNDHPDVWVAVEDGGSLVLASDDEALLFQACADWLRQDLDVWVKDVAWQHLDDGGAGPRCALRLQLAVKAQTAVAASF